jgi:hypothetical protein
MVIEVFPMNHKNFMHPAYILTGTVIFTAALPSEGGVVCIDRHLMCAPPPIQMGDMPEDGPHGPSRNAPLLTLTSTAAFTDSTTSMWLGPRYEV